jgi:hypothetical protein
LDSIKKGEIISDGNQCLGQNENKKNRSEIRELYKVSIDCESKDVIVVTNVLFDLG